eukprot:TRINITY_DN9184_c0_g1::TRINITY_DN9184_c0_g1_i1::g.12478::m.12478 TRINITY_DN9184_c0_g1::TRINITY_DN9184_c0_g1_i1::g.12478  ORF type:complete len:248 (+),score=35.26 TRINITY_DN9184_c0_g1_i1:703-1446(+)
MDIPTTYPNTYNFGFQISNGKIITEPTTSGIPKMGRGKTSSKRSLGTWSGAAGDNTYNNLDTQEEPMLGVTSNYGNPSNLSLNGNMGHTNGVGSTHGYLNGDGEFGGGGGYSSRTNASVPPRTGTRRVSDLVGPGLNPSIYSPGTISGDRPPRLERPRKGFDNDKFRVANGQTPSPVKAAPSYGDSNTLYLENPNDISSDDPMSLISPSYGMPQDPIIIDFSPKKPESLVLFDSADEDLMEDILRDT